MRTDHEWSLYPEGQGYDSTLRATWDGVHKASTTSNNEVTDTMRFGRGRIGALFSKVFLLQVKLMDPNILEHAPCHFVYQFRIAPVS